MYTEFYALKGLPFQLTPDPRFFFPSTEHNRAMAHLTYGMHQGEGFIVITGDVGAGKTTLVDYLLTTLPPSEHVTAKLVTTQLGANDLLRMIAAALNLFEKRAVKATLLKRIEEFLASAQAQGRRVLLVIDEAQNLPIQALEELRMLSNIIVKGRVPIQTVLLGQPQFREILARSELDQLRQRIIASYHLGPLSGGETRSYVEHRLKLVGWERDPEFADACFDEIFRYTGGIPRRNNTLCSRLMLLGFLEEKHVIADGMVSQVAKEMANELIAGGEKATVPQEKTTALPGQLNGDARTLESEGRAPDEIDKRLASIEKTVAHHDQAIRRALDVIARYLDRRPS